MKGRNVRRLIGLLIVSFALIIASTTAAIASQDVSSIEIAGSGWGHTIGMSQYGAYGRALAGQSYLEILDFYYDVPGQDLTTVTKSPVSEPIWVGLEQEAIQIVLKPVAIIGGGVETTLTRGTANEVTDTVLVSPGTSVTISGDGTTCTFALGGGESSEPGGCYLDLAWDGWELIPTVSIEFTRHWEYGTDATLPEDATACSRSIPYVCSYEYGELRVRPDNNRGLDLSQVLRLNDYVRGIGEVPAFWGSLGPEALKAQAVAARTYALNRSASRMLDGETFEQAVVRRSWCWCTIYDSSDEQASDKVNDQAYRGRVPGVTTGIWTTLASATDDEVILYNGEPILAEYGSSNGGSTQNYEDVRGGTPIPYLRAAPDPYTLDPGTGNPYISWTYMTSTDHIKENLNLDRITSIKVTDTYDSGMASAITITGVRKGTAVTLSSYLGKPIDGPLIQLWYGLRSPHITGITLFEGLASPEQPPPPPPSGPATVGVQDPRTGIWSLRIHDGSTKQFYYGDPNDIPFIGDWNGDGIETVGLYRKSVGFLFLRYTNTQGVADVDIYYGIPGDIPIAGDWNGDGVDTVGIYRPSEARFYLRNTNTQGIADVDLQFGEVGDVPIAGDWDGDGIDTVGVYRPSTKMVYLTDSISDGTISVSFEYVGAEAGDRVIAGDWDNDGSDTLGVFRPSTSTFYLRDTFTQQSANISFSLGSSWMNPIAGYWGG
ncbi:MAG: hypothetical protein BMS9Abin20_1240 [Acidimicrobiia bacterium]|nr:MAG: hypothetical protein BMS9Abin20_1240 [Acidimicrobiia bacterium]